MGLEGFDEQKLEEMLGEYVLKFEEDAVNTFLDMSLKDKRTDLSGLSEQAQKRSFFEALDNYSLDKYECVYDDYESLEEGRKERFDEFIKELGSKLEREVDPEKRGHKRSEFIQGNFLYVSVKEKIRESGRNDRLQVAEFLIDNYLSKREEIAERGKEIYQQVKAEGEEEPYLETVNKLYEMIIEEFKSSKYGEGGKGKEGLPEAIIPPEEEISPEEVLTAETPPPESAIEEMKYDDLMFEFKTFLMSYEANELIGAYIFGSENKASETLLKIAKDKDIDLERFKERIDEALLFNVFNDYHSSGVADRLNVFGEEEKVDWENARKDDEAIRKFLVYFLDDEFSVLGKKRVTGFQKARNSTNSCPQEKWTLLKWQNNYTPEASRK